MKENRPRRTHDVVRAGKFGIIGILNTALDFSIFNILTGMLNFGIIQGNIISTTASMLFSFSANKKLVFKSGNNPLVKQAIIFFAVTAFGLYVLQLGTITLLTQVWLAPVSLGLAIAHFLGIAGHDQFLAKNGAKAVASVVSLVWNYIMYKKVVFA